MTAILTTPIAVAAIVLAVAGAAKLRSPAGASRALAAAGFSVPGGVVRLIASGELALAALVLLAPGRAACALLAAMYGALALVARALMRRGATCGCFGGDDAPATAAHVGLSAALAIIAAAGLAWPAHGIAWLLAGSPGAMVPLALGIAGAAYATVLAYTELPSAWSAWRPQ
ncbi:MAG TPA: MauE/DoxX family redox-associated membrane protein [Solirubrobacteraceae bacterium]